MQNFFLYFTFVLFILSCIILILLVLIQKGRGGGLASAFGGGGGNTAFGSKTGDVLTWATSIVFGVFLALAIALNLIADDVNAAATKPPGAVAPAVTDGPTGPTAPARGGDTSLPQPLPAGPGIPARDPQTPPG